MYKVILLLTTIASLYACSPQQKPAAEDNEKPLTDHPGYTLYKTYCIACHGGTAKPEERVAPPAFMVQEHYKRRYTNKEDFVKAVVNWINQPDSANTLMPGAIRHFKLMPPLNLPVEQRQQIAEYLYDTRFTEPAWAQEHMRQERRRMNRQ